LNEKKKSSQKFDTQIRSEETGTGRSDIDDIPLYGDKDYKES